MPKKLNNDRRYSGSGPRPDKRKFKQTEAKERQDTWSKLTVQEQLSALDARFGKGVGASRQRKRLQAVLDSVSPKLKENVRLIPRPDTHNKAKERREAEQSARPARS